MLIKEIEKNLRNLKNLKIPEFFGGNSDEDDYEWLYTWSESDEIKNLLNTPHYCAHGVSKFVFVLKEYDWVIKIPFNGSYLNCWNEKDKNYNEEWNPFNGANGWDYCNIELEKYEEAQSRGLECFFADTRYLCSNRDYHPIYIQEKVIPCSDDRTKRTPSNKALEFVKSKHYFNPTWIAIAIDFYGEEKVNQFLDYIMNIDPVIYEDLHDGNYGYREDGSPCLLDFSGWCED